MAHAEKSNKKDKGYGGFLQSIRGKVLVMGIVALAVSGILGVVGITALNQNKRNQDILTEMNHINLYQYENQSLDTSYLYFLEQEYLDSIISNLAAMEDNAASAGEAAGLKYSDDIKKMSEAIGACKSNYEVIKSQSAERGYTSEMGMYQQFLADDESLTEHFNAIKDDKSWVDGRWSETLAAGNTVSIDGKDYIRFTYSADIEKNGKRNYFCMRVGGTGADYAGSIYFGNIIFGGEKEIPYEIQELKEDELSGSYGDALQTISVTELDGIPVIKTDAVFTAANNSWEEVTLKLPVDKYDVQNYNSVTFDIYLEVGDCSELKAAYALSEKYSFDDTLSDINSDFAVYSKHVVEGSDVAEEAENIRKQFEEIKTNLDAYVSDEEKRSQIVSVVNSKQEQFETMTEKDNTVLNLKQDNIALSEQLTSLTSSVRERVEEDTSASQSRLIFRILVIFLVSAVILLMLTVVIGRSINGSMRVFKNTLSQMTAGNLAVRASVKGKDEFAQFGRYINEFLERLSDVIQKAQGISITVKQSGEQLDTMAENSGLTSAEIGKAVEEISRGAMTQASEADMASGQIEEMGRAFGMIVENVEHLGETAEEMRQISVESAQFMQELGVANDKTVDAFSQVAKQTYMTNESVQKIREAAELITSIASQTNLLSLNASIEAARAGEAGRGFAVVATEISQLAEQSNSSAGIIKQIIEELAEQAEHTVQIVDDVSKIVEQQQEKLEQTKAHFASLEHGIEVSSEETMQIRQETGICDDARHKVEEVIVNLSAISEENAASTEQTTASMTELNATIRQLVDSAGKLKEMSGRLESDLKYFHM